MKVKARSPVPRFSTVNLPASFSIWTSTGFQRELWVPPANIRCSSRVLAVSGPSISTWMPCQSLRMRPAKGEAEAVESLGEHLVDQRQQAPGVVA